MAKPRPITWLVLAQLATGGDIIGRREVQALTEEQACEFARRYFPDGALLTGRPAG